MDSKIEIKEEDSLTDDTVSRNEREFFDKVDALVTNCDMAVKTEIKPEPPFIKHPVKQIKSETVTSNNNWELKRKTEFAQQTLFLGVGSQNKEDFQEDPVIMDKKYNSDQEIYNKIEIKEEAWWLERDTSSFCDNIKDGELPAVKSSRLYPDTYADGINDKSPMLLAEVPARYTGFRNDIDLLEYEYKKCEVRTAKEDVHSDQYDNCSGEADRCIQPLYLQHRSLNHMSKSQQQSSICENSFSCLPKAHNSVHGGKKPYECKTCSKSFTCLDHWKSHNVVHEFKKANQCKVCDKSFTRLSDLKRHYLIHNGKRSHPCKVCNRSFTQRSDLEKHNLVHEGKKPHQCKVCDRSFTQLSTLKTHILIHESKKPHQCTICNRTFTHLLDLETHNLLHVGKKSYLCKVCSRSFTHLCYLKRHNLVHEGKKPHQCKVCDRSFTQLSSLKKHNLVHGGKKPHHCKVCDKRFTDLFSLKRHHVVHEDKSF